MDSSKSKEIKVGIVSLIAIILLIVGLGLGKQYSVSVVYKQIKLRFPNSAGIEMTSPIFVNGVKRGKVLQVFPSNGGVLITAEIDEVNDLKSDVKARLGIMEITGGKKIEITPGISSVKFDIANEIPGMTSPDVGDMVAMLGEMGNDAKVLLKKLDTIATAASNLIARQDSYDRLEKTVINTSEIVQDLHTFVRGNISTLELVVSNLKTITNDLKLAINKYEPRIDTMTGKLDNTIDEARRLIHTSEDAIKNADKLIGDLAEFTKDIKNPEGTVGKLIYDKNLASKLDSTFTSLQDLVNAIKQYGINVNVRLGTRP